MLERVLPLAFAIGPSIVYDLIRRRMGEIIPLNTLLGIEIVSIGDGVAQARVPFRTELTNHLGTMHATAIFGVAEAASGAAMSGAFAPVILRIRPVAVNATIAFSKMVRSDLTAHGRTSESSQELRAKLADTGKVVFDVTVDLRDASEADVAQVTVAWHVTSK